MIFINLFFFNNSIYFLDQIQILQFKSHLKVVFELISDAFIVIEVQWELFVLVIKMSIIFGLKIF
jgi:hypothetical protein